MTYIASGATDADTCPGEKCLRNAIEQVNLTTGEVTQIHSWSDSRNGSTQTHDVDRINESVYLIADINYPDRVHMVNVTSGETIWEWKVSDVYVPKSGGNYPSDWTHINDVEYLPDGRVMANLRNQDQVVFIEPGAGIQDEWTLGTDDDHDILYEAHNPDYIPEECGGPAVLIADSENNRLVEYQRVAGEWKRTWHWQDPIMQWPRDADRLPSGRTLITDSHGKRILSVRSDGTIAWSQQVPTGSYDIEILGTGDESTGGESAKILGLASRRPGAFVFDGNPAMGDSIVGPGITANGTCAATPASNGSNQGGTAGSDNAGELGDLLSTTVSLLVYGVAVFIPPLLVHGLLFILPTWAGLVDAILLLVTGFVGAVWISTEAGIRLLARLRSMQH